jgi:ammonia channel protein AmtB
MVTLSYLFPRHQSWEEEFCRMDVKLLFRTNVTAFFVDRVRLPNENSRSIDFVGGLLVHFTYGVGVLVEALVLDLRQDLPHSPMRPYSRTMVVMGAASPSFRSLGILNATNVWLSLRK